MVVFCAVLVLPAVMFPLHAGAAPSQENGPGAQASGAKFSDVAGKNWLLSEVKSAGKTITIDRGKLAADNMGGFFTISFRENQAGGVAAPNRYTGPYTVSNMNLSFGTFATTMMLAFKEPDGLNEREYLDYLSRISGWNLSGGRLELYGKDSAGSKTVLTFSLE